MVLIHNGTLQNGTLHSGTFLNSILQYTTVHYKIVCYKMYCVTKRYSDKMEHRQETVHVTKRYMLQNGTLQNGTVPDPDKGVCADPVNGVAILERGGARSPRWEQGALVEPR
jgi:hypothetical protein